MGDRSIDRTYWDPLTVQVNSDTLSAATGYMEKKSRFWAGRGEDAGTSRNGKECVCDFGYTKLNNPGWCATWPHCNVTKAVVVKLLNFKSVFSNKGAGREYQFLMCEQSSTTRKRRSRFWQIAAHRNESVIIVLFGSEAARVWLGHLQLSCG
jgi:hypothetical protein